MAAPDTCQRRSSFTINAMPWRWWPRRMAASLSSPGRPANRWYTHIASIPCCCKQSGECDFMSTPLNMHAARMALNQDSELRKWAEAWLKSKERAVQSTMTDEEFAKHWLYVRPERMHDGAIDAVAAYQLTNKP